ncbi:ABC transporter permease [Vibrio sp. SCSIO 43137]|uniref:ABC transporter permease n=1 Tax=Vibrio sp. SCSIO 43137 TaxID=3021011 RepID=UPI0023070E52|nr:ABC transporter permease [Vibrio sp. SCSIO 43137]WCE28835.1 ABC transporter permease [Vibrio sp. SCSIO 43137]
MESHTKLNTDNSFAMNAEIVTDKSLTYWQLVRARFRHNRYGMMGLVGCLLVFLSAVLSGFIAPYSAHTKNSAALYSPPQLVKIWQEGKGISMPFVYPYLEEMDMETFEITFKPDLANPVYLTLFPEGDDWKWMGMTFNRHLFGGENGKSIHLLGTDNLGRDVFSRMIFGTQITLLMGLLVVSAAGVIGTLVGVASGYFGGVFDVVTQRIVEFLKAFPDLPLILALVAILPKRAEPVTIFILFALIMVLLKWTDLSRELRGKVIAVRSMEYVRAAVAIGASDRRIITRHIVPNMSSHIIVWVTYFLPEVILLESFLSFLGVGVQAPMVSWGVMLNQIRDFQSFSAAPWLMAPVGMVVISVLSFNALGDGLRDAMDPYAND